MPNFEASLEIVNCVIRDGRERIEQLTVRNAELEVKQGNSASEELKLADARLKWLQSLLECAGLLAACPQCVALYRVQPK